MKHDTKPCPKCNGTGRVIDDGAVGRQLRAVREHSGKSLRYVAGKLNISAAYLSDLEIGNRRWSPERIAAFRREVNGK